MGMNLSGDHGRHFRATLVAWDRLLQLAVEAGWQPQGTEAPDERDGVWDGEGLAAYCSNDGQYVSAEDAASLGDALDWALADDYDEERLPTAYVREFITFCRGGGFLIY